MSGKNVHWQIGFWHQTQNGAEEGTKRKNIMI